MRNEVSYVAPGRTGRLINHDVTVMVTETGRTYVITNDPFVCYIDAAGNAYTTAQWFIKWWNRL